MTLAVQFVLPGFPGERWIVTTDVERFPGKQVLRIESFDGITRLRQLAQLAYAAADACETNDREGPC